ncbi:hypothetical protein CRE_14192 [Caenorhabditis remanei]|uniref:Uncharacterized protein n=1 Tax=Caenorhabditis remanei TaxID=31234 RepID=E3N1K7_CAERE|nr:hypothetical protein CRE_14192 [Caenorhabditis remanei]
MQYRAHSMIMSIPSALSNTGGIFETPAKIVDELVKHRRMAKGYEETRHPHVPKILKKTVDFQEIKKTYGYLGVTVGVAGIEHGSKECLDWIQKFVGERYKAISDSIEIPQNAIAVSMAGSNFEIGSSCQEFRAIRAYKAGGPGEKGYFSYKRLSKNLQITIYNDELGNQFLAGCCFYPTAAGKIVTCMDDQKTIFYNELAKMEPFPLANRAHNFYYKNRGKYGRYCSIAQCRVLVWTGKSDGQIVHELYDPFFNEITYKGCAECAQDFKNYKFEEPEKEEPKKAETEKTEPEKAETEKPEPEKEEPRKEEPKKIGQVAEKSESSETKQVANDEKHDDIPDDFDALDDISNFDAISIH